MLPDSYAEVLDLLEKALYIFVGQENAKLQAFKVGGSKKILLLGSLRVVWVWYPDDGSILKVWKV